MEAKTEEKKVKLFREKSLEAVESPESLNDYLRVTSPGVWLVLAAVIMVLFGAVLWGIFGSIETTGHFAVVVKDGNATCYVPYSKMESAAKQGSISINGETYPLREEPAYDVLYISEETNPYIRLYGGMKIGDAALEVPVEGNLADGMYIGDVVTERLRPISLLLQ